VDHELGLRDRVPGSRARLEEVRVGVRIREDRDHRGPRAADLPGDVPVDVLGGDKSDLVAAGMAAAAAEPKRGRDSAADNNDCGCSDNDSHVHPSAILRQVSNAELKQRLADRGVHPTRQRLAVLGELAKEPNDATATALWRRMRARKSQTIGLATVYRTLALLNERGVVASLSHRANERGARRC